jgi:hypothetical protein
MLGEMRTRCMKSMPLAVLGLLGAAVHDAAAASQDATSGDAAAVWSPREVKFTYHGFTTEYSCDGLQEKMRGILLSLGARRGDLQVRSWGCTRLRGPDPFAGVQVRMHVLEPAGNDAAAPTIRAQWRSVDLMARREVVDAAGDCELISQIKQQVLPLIPTRSVEYRSVCEKHHLLPGATELKVQVLVPEHSGVPAPPAQ